MLVLLMFFFGLWEYLQEFDVDENDSNSEVSYIYSIQICIFVIQCIFVWNLYEVEDDEIFCYILYSLFEVLCKVEIFVFLVECVQFW